MKCLRKYKWVKLTRIHLPSGKGLMGYWAKLASRAAFRKGNAVYCGHINPVTVGMWSGGVVGLKSILGVKKRVQALWIMNQLQDFGYISYSLDPKTKQLTYQINDWVLMCSGAECKDGAVYATEGYGFLYMPRNITERLVGKRSFEESERVYQGTSDRIGNERNYRDQHQGSRECSGRTSVRSVEELTALLLRWNEN